MALKTNKSITGILFIGLFCLLIGFSAPKRSHDPILQMLSSLTEHERYCLDIFLKKTFLFSEFSYVLFGHKPFALRSYSETKRFPLFDRCGITNLNLKKGLDVFRKNSHLFNKKNFSVLFRDNLEYVDLYLINKSAFEKILNENNVECDFSIKKEIHLPENIFGLLLGYGKNNSQLFHEKSKTLKELDNFIISVKREKSLRNKITKMSKQLKPFGVKSEYPRSIFQSFLKDPFVSLPGFMADPNDFETKQLEKLYKQDREEIVRVAMLPNAVEVICRRLAS